ncbi:MAG TPA: fumarylacetoacetate hydrolase family protein [Vicinamibacterales bacterium]|jgi:2,4-diketo-3-deoxy-L-fuconate hydrolase|nr:fumarylacetoacetate hydrolase family protein [Vicinamibacterales bacterium]
MRIANVNGRATIVSRGGGCDLATASSGRFSPVVDDAIRQVDAIAAWLSARNPEFDVRLSTDVLRTRLHELGPPVTRPRQVFAIGVNYPSHSDEARLPLPDSPIVFTKFPSSITGPGATVRLPTLTTDWEVELVAVVGRGGRRISEDQALVALAGYCVGQDLTERVRQSAGKPPQWSLAKSFADFSPIGPWLTTLDELADPLDLAIRCHLNDETVQRARTSEMVFGVPQLIAYLSHVCELFPGDLIFTGTPDGIGAARTPPRFLEPGVVLRSEIEGLGWLNNACTEAICS